MIRNRQRSVRLGVSILGVLILSPALLGQAPQSARESIPVPTDWSHQHVIFSMPATTEEAERVQHDPRYWQQRYRREMPVTAPAAEISQDSSAQLPADLKAPGPGGRKLHHDWQESLGSGASVGAGNYPAKFSFLTSTANCASATQPDFVVYGTGLVGSGTQASVVAYDNLYSGCIGTVPSVYWAYNTGGAILTSPVFSGDGTQVAFVQTSGGQAGLVLLKWKASTTESVGSPMTLTAVSASAYPGCSAPCMTEIFLHDGAHNPLDDTTSSAYYDYTHDVAWVGGALGWLHKIAPVFNGIPAEVSTGGLPVHVASTTFLSSPVFDQVSKNVFVGDAGGIFYRVDSTSAAVTASGQLDFGTGLVAGPILDQSKSLIYVFSSSDGTAHCGGGTVACSAVYQLSTTFAASSTGSKKTVGNSVAFGTLPNPSPMYVGGFDSAYYASTDATGNLYVCGNTGANPILYRVPILAGALGTPAQVGALTPSGTPICSPVTDILNPNASGGAAERVFFSVQDLGHPTACAAGGCAMSFVDSPWQASTSFAVGQEVLVLSSNTLYINVAIVAGTSGSTAPTWPNVVGALTLDGGVTWLNQGLTTLVALPNWAASHTYTAPTRILDSNGNVEIVTIPGVSGTPTAPTWSTTAGGLTVDGTVTWINAGVLPSAALASAGGTSGIIIDNFVGSGTMAGASQVYFSTLSDQLCTTSATTGGCAMQASQSALK